MLITLIGVDGSGKTTQARILYKVFKRFNYKVKFIYAGNTGIKLGKKYSFYLSIPVDIIIHRILKVQDKSSLLRSKYRFLLKFESYLLFLNYIILILPKILLCRQIYQLLITDRYVYDYILQRAIFEGSLSTINKILILMTPKPDLVTVFDLDEKIACNRKIEEKSVGELNILRRLYLRLGTKLSGHIIDASKPIAVVSDEILRLINDKIVVIH